MDNDFSTGSDMDSEEEQYRNDSDSETVSDDSIFPIAKKIPRINVIYDAEESKNEVPTINVQSVTEATRSGNMWTEVEGDPSVFEFRG